MVCLRVANDSLLSYMTQESLSMTVGEDAFWHQLLASSPSNKATELFNLVYQKMCFPGINREDFKETVAPDIEDLGKETILDKMLSHDIDRLMTMTIDSLVGNQLIIVGATLLNRSWRHWILTHLQTIINVCLAILQGSR